MFSPLRLNCRESVSTSGAESVSGEVVAVTTAGVVGGADDVSNGDEGDDLWEESIESLVTQAAVMASSSSSGRTVGRASKRQQVGRDKPIKNMTKLGSLARASMLSMTDDDLINYFIAHLEGTETAMECINMSCVCLSILDDVNVRQAVAKYLVWFERKLKFEQDSVVMEWYRYARLGTDKANFFQLSFDGSLTSPLPIWST